MPEEDIANMPAADTSWLSPLTSINLKDSNIGSIIWTTGFSADYGYIKLLVFDKHGKPKHQMGIAPE